MERQQSANERLGLNQPVPAYGQLLPLDCASGEYGSFQLAGVCYWSNDEAASVFGDTVLEAYSSELVSADLQDGQLPR
ncbi:hypothetical protein D3C76_1191000 [compost metagenome]